MENLTQSQKDQIAKLEAEYKAITDNALENAKYRMQNYLDCKDDYSWGGACDQASDNEVRQAKLHLDLSKEQIINGGFLTYNSTKTVFKNIDSDEVVGEGMFNGDYGSCCRLNDGRYIGQAKRLSTYAKKGLKLYIQETEYKMVYSGISKNGNPIYKNIEVLEQNETESTSGEFKRASIVDFYYSRQ